MLKEDPKSLEGLTKEGGMDKRVHAVGCCGFNLQTTGLRQHDGDSLKNGTDADKARVGREAHCALKVFQERHGDNFDARLF